MFHMLLIIFTLLSLAHQTSASEQSMGKVNMKINVCKPGNCLYKYSNLKNVKLLQSLNIKVQEHDPCIALQTISAAPITCMVNNEKRALSTYETIFTEPCEPKDNIKLFDEQTYAKIYKKLKDINALPFHYFLTQNNTFKTQNNAILTVPITLDNEAQLLVTLLLNNDYLSTENHESSLQAFIKTPGCDVGDQNELIERKLLDKNFSHAENGYPPALEVLKQQKQKNIFSSSYKPLYYLLGLGGLIAIYTLYKRLYA